MGEEVEVAEVVTVKLWIRPATQAVAPFSIIAVATAFMPIVHSAVEAAALKVAVLEAAAPKLNLRLKVVVEVDWDGTGGAGGDGPYGGDGGNGTGGKGGNTNWAGSKI